MPLKLGRQREITVLICQVTAINMTSSQVKHFGSKIVSRSNLRVETTKDKINVKEYKRIATWNVRTLLRCGKLENLKINEN